MRHMRCKTRRKTTILTELTQDEYKRLRKQRAMDRIKDAKSVGLPPPTDSEIRELLEMDIPTV